MAYVDLILANTDPVSAVLIGVVWLRLERIGRRVSRAEEELMDGGQASV